MVIDEELFRLLEETYGLDTILLQNDIEHWVVVEMLYKSGLIDMDDYLFTDEVIDEDED
jgi:hypothetical protein